MTLSKNSWIYRFQLYGFLFGIYFMLVYYVLLVVDTYVLFKRRHHFKFFFLKTYKFVDYLHLWIGIYCALYLIWRYNTFIKFTEFTELDRLISFHAGMFILGVVILNRVQEKLLF
jgi:hypothetical protein